MCDRMCARVCVCRGGCAWCSVHLVLYLLCCVRWQSHSEPESPPKPQACSFCDTATADQSEHGGEIYVCIEEGCTRCFHAKCFAKHAYFHNDFYNAKLNADDDEEAAKAVFKRGYCCPHTNDGNFRMQNFQYDSTAPVKYVLAGFQNAVGPRVPKGTAGAPGTLGSGTAPLLPAALADGRACLLARAGSPMLTQGEVCVFVCVWGGLWVALVRDWRGPQRWACVRVSVLVAFG